MKTRKEWQRLWQCLAAAVLLAAMVPMAGCAEKSAPAEPCCGCYSDAPVTSEQVRAAAAFAIQAQQDALRQQPDTPSAQLELIAIVQAEEQVVAGMNYKMQLKVRLDGRERTAEAVVWEQLWQPVPYRLTSWTWR